jgi:hypothetical protein
MILRSTTFAQDFYIVPEYEQLIEDWQKFSKLFDASYKLWRDVLITNEQHFEIHKSYVKYLNEVKFHSIIPNNIMNNETDWKIIK